MTSSNTLDLDNDVDREILVNFKVYRIVKVEQANVGDNSTWNITIDKPYAEATAKNMKHAVGSVFVGAPWEVVIPTEARLSEESKRQVAGLSIDIVASHA